MARARVVVNPIYEGGAGGYSFYSRSGEQIMRQRKNNSNYGEGARRTLSQQLRRVKWANLVNMYKCMAYWQPKAYELKKKGQTDYNLFMSLNINRSEVGLTKGMASAGCAVVESLQVAQGSLPQLTGPGAEIEGYFRTNIVLSEDITASTTIAAISADIIANNPFFVNGDNIGCVLFYNTLGANRYPYASSRYFELTLDTSNTALLSSIPYGSRFARQQEGTAGPFVLCLQYQNDVDEVCAAFIHTRKVNGSLLTSNAFIQMSGREFWEQFSSESWLVDCAETYGIDAEVPLDPSFPEATIEEVTINGSPVSSPMGRTIEVTGQAELVIFGKNLNDDSLSLYHNGVKYTPLVRDNESLTFILGDNGSNRVTLNGMFAFTVEVSGISVPGILPIGMSVAQQKGTAIEPISDNVGERVGSNSTNCINAPIRETDFYNHIQCSFGSLEMQESDFSGSNCTINNYGQTNSRTRVIVSVDDMSKPSYVTFQGFIVAVFNYS